MKCRIVQGAWVLALLVVLLIASCTNSTEGTQPSTKSSAVAGGAPGKAPTKESRPVDRNMQAVTVALRRVDACSVFDLSAAKAANPNAALLPIGPHACMLTPTANYKPGDNGVKVLVGDNSNDLFLNTGAPITIAGAKAYERHDYSSAIFKRCEIDFPVSFSRSIHFQYQDDGADVCQVLHKVAEAAVPRLQNPDALTVDVGKRPFAAWDGCYFMAQLLGNGTQDNYTYKPHGLNDPFSGCRTTLKPTSGTPSKGGPSAAGPSAPSKGGPGAAAPSLQRNEPELEIGYDRVPDTSKQTRQIAGKTADVTSFTSTCRLTWNQADAKTGNQWYGALVIKLTAATCDGAAKLAGQAVALVDQQPSDASAPPQRPLLFRPEENDSPEPGACVDWNGAAGCEPYHPVQPPQGIENLLPAADRDQNVTCAVFQDAVKGQFGATFNPVTWGEHCFFVEPTHTLLLRCNVDGKNRPSDYGRRSDLYSDRQEIQIAGKPAVTFWDKEHSQYDIYLSPFGDLNRPGNLHINLQSRPGRGDTSVPKGGRPKIDAAKANLAKQVITQITQKYVAG